MNTSKILAIVDDEPAVTTLFGALYRRRGFEVHTFAEGSYLLEWLKTNRCDACLLDLQLPGYDGFTLLCMLRDQFPSLKVIIFSGLPSTLEEEAALSLAGAAGFIHKTTPFEEGAKELDRVLPPPPRIRRLELAKEKTAGISTLITRRIQRSPVRIATKAPLYAGG